MSRSAVSRCEAGLTVRSTRGSSSDRGGLGTTHHHHHHHHLLHHPHSDQTTLHKQRPKGQASRQSPTEACCQPSEEQLTVGVGSSELLRAAQSCSQLLRPRGAVGGELLLRISLQEEVYGGDYRRKSPAHVLLTTCSGSAHSLGGIFSGSPQDMIRWVHR